MGAIVSRDTLGLGAIAATDVFALELDRDVLLDIFDDHFPILLDAIRDAAGRHLALIRTMSQIPKQLPRIRREPPPADRLDLVDRHRAQPGGPFERSALDALAEVADRARQRTIEPGTILWNEGEHAGGGCLLISGTLACSSSTDNGPVTFRVEPGVAIGALEAMAGQPRWHNAVAETRVEVLEYDVDDLIDVIEDNVDMGTDFLSWVSSDALNMIERVYGPGPELLYFLTTSQAMSESG
jgi:CRP-like cAMP-binding protein